jgi:hypothetical protein
MSHLPFLSRLNKTKRKHKPGFEFVIPYPLEDCVFRLRNQKNLARLHLYVKLARLDMQNWQFHVRWLRSPKRNTKRHIFDRTIHIAGVSHAISFMWLLEADGLLTRTLSETTLVMGHCRLDWSVFALGLVFVTIAVGLLMALATILPVLAGLIAILLLPVLIYQAFLEPVLMHD